MSQETTLTSILAFIFGHKYYANIINTRGTNKLEISSYIFRTREEALAHKKRIEETRSFLYVETISFRSHKDY